MSFYYNREGYCDPTAGAALSNISRKERRDRKRKRKRLVLKKNEKTRTESVSGAR